MVTTSPPFAWTANIVQDFTANPLTWTTHAPHCDVSQPICVPVIFSFSRRNSTRRRRSSTSAETLLPFTVTVTLVIIPSSWSRSGLRPSAPLDFSPRRAFGPPRLLWSLSEQDDRDDDDRECDQAPHIRPAEK